jgi:hypothetical protein
MPRGFTEGVQDPGKATTTSFGTAWSAAIQDLEQLGAYPALALVVIAGLVGILYWTLFRQDTDSPAEALAVAAYATAHATILSQCADFIFELFVHYGAPRAQVSTAFDRSSEALIRAFSRVGALGQACGTASKGDLD